MANGYLPIRHPDPRLSFQETAFWWGRLELGFRLLDVWPWAMCLTLQSLSFSTCKTKTINVCMFLDQDQ